MSKLKGYKLLKTIHCNNAGAMYFWKNMSKKKEVKVIEHQAQYIADIYVLEDRYKNYHTTEEIG